MLYVATMISDLATPATPFTIISISRKTFADFEIHRFRRTC